MRISDWSSDVCSSDLIGNDRIVLGAEIAAGERGLAGGGHRLNDDHTGTAAGALGLVAEMAVHRHPPTPRASRRATPRPYPSIPALPVSPNHTPPSQPHPPHPPPTPPPTPPPHP